MLAALLSLVIATPTGMLTGTSPVPVVHATLTSSRATHRRHAAHRRHHARLRSVVIPHLREWECIHSYEAPSWRTADPPYYGGLQMDIGFQESYGATYLRTEGTANNWTPAQQMTAAERAWRVRGFSPWPNTARMCGLLG